MVTPTGLLRHHPHVSLWKGDIGHVICDKWLLPHVLRTVLDPAKWDIPAVAEHLTAWYWRDVCKLPQDRIQQLVAYDPDSDEYYVRVADAYQYVHRRPCPASMLGMLLSSVQMAMTFADDPNIGDMATLVSLPPPPDAYHPCWFGTLCWMIRRLPPPRC